MTKPPYTITPKMLQLVAAISEQIGAVNSLYLTKPPTELRKKNRIKTIQSSLEIEGNTLTIEQITALMEHKRVLGPAKDILEVNNAIMVYEQLDSFDPNSFKSFCRAHGIMMKGLIENAGRLRSQAVGIVKGNALAHVAPPSSMVKPLLNNLFAYLKKDNDLVFIKSSVFHYAMEFIHPFSDGNGRMGRLWQTLILKQAYPIFAYLPLESGIKTRQAEYYQTLDKSDRQGQSTIFIEFMLEVILESLSGITKVPTEPLSSIDRLEVFRDHNQIANFSRKDYLGYFKNVSPATASRDLRLGVDKSLLLKTGDKNLTRYEFIERITDR